MPFGDLLQKDEATVAVRDYMVEGGRFDHHLFHFANVIQRRRAAVGIPDGFLFGPKMTYADVALFYFLEACKQQFATGTPFPYWHDPCRRAAVEVCESYLVSCLRVENLRAYCTSERRRPWAGDSCM